MAVLRARVQKETANGILRSRSYLASRRGRFLKVRIFNRYLLTRSGLYYAGGVTAISRWLSGAIPPVGELCS